MSETNEGRVLLVDDERLVRFTLSAWLKTSHFEVTAVASPNEAIAALKAGVYDAILTDVMMGTVDGFMLRDAVRGFNARIPVIFLTALVNTPTNQLQARIAADPYSAYVTKSARRDVLLACVRNAVRGYRAEREATELKAAMRADLEIAACVQTALLPPEIVFGPQLFGSALSRPYDVVTGDFHHWFRLSDTAGILVYGDISGHGTPAALAMTAVLSHLRDMAASEGVRTRQVHLICDDLARFVRRNLRGICYLTGTVLYADFDRNVVRYLNAGGTEPLCFARSDGARVELNPGKKGNLPMGLMDDTVYSADDVVEASFPVDALFCLYSDGYSDLSTDPAGEDRLPTDVLQGLVAELIRSASGTTDLASMPFRLNDLLRDMGYVHQRDDMHFLVGGRSMAHALRFLRTVRMESSDGIDRLVEAAAQWAAERKLPDETIAKMELLLNEHLENVRSHGLNDQQRRFAISVVEMRPSEGDLEIRVWDRGASWEGDLSETAPHPDLALDAQNAALADSGRGLAILRKIAHRITYEQFEGLNKFTFLIGTKAG